jgi:Fe-S oxidoreductase
MSVVELAYSYFKEGRIKLERGAVDASVTYHDPCNVGRKLGIFEPPRELIKTVAPNFIEMWPNREYSLCCGGGGSVGQNSALGKRRLENARRKYDQMMRTGAEILTTGCQNCLSQLDDLKAYYKIPMEVKSVMELLSDCIVY